MPTQSDSGNWRAENPPARRSVFSNYRQSALPSAEERGIHAASTSDVGPTSKLSESQAKGISKRHECRAPSNGVSLQATIDTAVSRSWLYQFLARAFDDPNLECWTWLTHSETHIALCSVSRVLASQSSGPGLERLTHSVSATLRPDQLEVFQIAYVTAFGHAARGDCPLNEIEFGDLKTDPLFQPHRLADLAAFYRAFGMQVADAAAERPDHIGMELEFMSVLTAREAYAREHQLDEAQLSICLDAQKKFLREHLGRWALAFARRLSRSAVHPALAALSDLTGAFIAAECARFNLPAGSEDLLLRPVDEAGESLCASCGLAGPAHGTH